GSLKEFHQTHEVVLELSIQRESILETDLQWLNSELSVKDAELSTEEAKLLKRLDHSY
ncbi:hypothetical protein HAX54_002735, partial [Datura stramonium]|nr:hypothetical protein [Datura stramonium]